MLGCDWQCLGVASGVSVVSASDMLILERSEHCQLIQVKPGWLKLQVKTLWEERDTKVTEEMLQFHVMEIGQKLGEALVGKDVIGNSILYLECKYIKIYLIFVNITYIYILYR